MWPCIVGLLLALSVPAHANVGDWPAPDLGNAFQLEYIGALLPDDSGGTYAFIAGANVFDSVRVVHVMSDGARDPSEPAKGWAIARMSGAAAHIRLLRDAPGGGYLAWIECTPPQVPSTPCYALATFHVLHVGTDGRPVPGWPTNGISFAGHRANAVERSWSVAPDGLGGVLVAWGEGPSNGPFDIRVRRIDASGVEQWTVDACTATGNQLMPVLSADTSGVRVAWTDHRSVLTGPDVYAQRLSLAGVRLWSTNGRAVAVDFAPEEARGVVSLAGLASLVLWTDADAGPALRATALDATGLAVNEPGTDLGLMGGVDLELGRIGESVAMAQWRDGGGLLHLAVLDDQGARIGDDPWNDPPLAFNPSGPAQLIVSQGSVLGSSAWTSQGASGTDDHVRLLHIGTDGEAAPGWPPEGERVTSGPGWNHLLAVATSPHEGRDFILALRWPSSDYTQAPRLGVQRVTHGDVGTEPRGPATFAFEAIRPNPTSGGAMASFRLPRPGPVRLDVFDLSGRRVAGMVRECASGANAFALPLPDRLAPGVYGARLTFEGRFTARRFVRLR